MKARVSPGVLLLAALAASGCGGAEEQQPQQQETEAAPAAEMMSGMATVQLASLNNSGITGTANVSHTQDEISVSVQLAGLTAGESYPAHVHRGSCEQQGPVAAPLGSIQAAEDGSASAQFSLSMDQFQGEMAMGEGEMMEGEGEHAMGEGEMMEGEGEHAMGEGEMMEGEAHEGVSYYVQVHNPDGAPVACGDVEMPRGEMSEGM